MQPSPGKGSQDVERRVLYSRRLEEVQRLAEDRLRVVVETEDDSRLHRYAVRMDPLYRPRVVGYAIEPFVDFVHAGLRNRFQPDEQLLAAASRGQLQELVVLGGMNARLAAPPFAMRSEGLEQRLGVLDVARDVVVPEDDHLAGERAVLFRHRCYGPLAYVALIHDRDRAEIAPVRAAARGKEDSAGMVAPVKQVFPRHGSLFQGWGFSGTVALPMPSRLEVLQELRPVGFSLPDEDHVRVRLRLVWHQSHMRPTQHHWNPPLPGTGRPRHTRGARSGCGR